MEELGELQINKNQQNIINKLGLTSKSEIDSSLHDIGNEGTRSLLSSKIGNGIEKLGDDNL